MKVYLLIIEDRHTDVEVEVFADKDAAIQRAVDVVAEYAYEPEDPNGPAGNWLFNATLSGEGDCLRVEEATVK